MKGEFTLKKKFDNKGSAIIEMTFLIPILLGIIYLYIMLFLFLLESAEYKEIMVESLYSIQEDQTEKSAATEEGIERGFWLRSKNGTQISIFVNEKAELFDIELEMHCNEDKTVENIRRWQLAADTIRTGENE